MAKYWRKCVTVAKPKKKRKKTRMEETPPANPDQKLDIEDQFILRLPHKHANKIHDILKTKPKKLKKSLFIDLDVENKTGMVILNKKKIPGKLVTLPTTVESAKCTNKVHLFKTADVSQMLICGPDAVKGPEEGGDRDKDKVYPHGLTPPLKNVKKSRFRKQMRNMSDPNEGEVEKEILWLLRMDNSAVASKFEILYEEDKVVQEPVDEKYIFGEVISDDSEHESSSDVNEIIEYNN